jgi:hypothetical protein
MFTIHAKQGQAHLASPRFDKILFAKSLIAFIELGYNLDLEVF